MKKLIVLLFVAFLLLLSACTPDELQKEIPVTSTAEVDPATIKPPTHG